MTSEEIIQRLLDEKRITVSEALIILKDIAKEAIKEYLPFNSGNTKEIPKNPIVVMYGIGVPDDTWTITSTSSSASTNK